VHVNLTGRKNARDAMIIQKLPGAMCAPAI